MKKIFSIAAALLCVCGINAQQFVIEGRIPGLKQGTPIKVETSERGRDKIAEGVAADGTFRITGTVSSPTMCEITFETGNEEKDLMDSSIELMLDNSNVTIEAEHVDSLPPSFCFGPMGLQREARLKISGGTTQKEHLEYRAAMRPLEIAKSIAHYNLWVAREPGRTAEREAQLEKIFDNAEKAYNEANRKFIELHPTYAISLYKWCAAMEEQYAYTAKELDDIWASVQPAADKVRLAALKKGIDENRKHLRNTLWTDFTALAPDNTKHKASEWVKSGEWAVIDFWASWCGPCRAAIPHVREMWKKYKKVNFLAVSLDRKDADWRKAMEQEKMEWTQLCLPTDLAKPVTEVYNIHGIPYMLVINDKGEIMFAGHDPAAVEAMLESASK
ncbi:MAG: AhpC/TSA family protein [Prevotella sp.]|nr:AhpC/TSA family protein [Prevotella sp.]